MEREIEVFCFPTLSPPDKEHIKWYHFNGYEIGRVLPDGRIENTDYRFKRRGIRGGIAVTKYSRLIRTSNSHLKNPATGDVFKETKKKTGYWNKDRQCFVKPYYERNRE